MINQVKRRSGLPALSGNWPGFVILLLIVSCALVLRCWHLMQDGLWTDEMISMYTSSPEASLKRTYDVLHFWDQTPPLYPLLLWLWLKITGFTDLNARLFSVLGGLLGLIASYRLVADFFQKRTALAVSFVVAITPYHIYFSREARSYIWALLVATLFLHAVLRRLRGDSGRWLRAWFIFSGAAFLYISYFSLFLQAAIFAVVIALWCCRRLSFARVRCWLVDWLAMGLLYLPWLIPFSRILSYHNGISASKPLPWYAFEVLSVFSSTVSAGWILAGAYVVVLMLAVTRLVESRRVQNQEKLLFFSLILLLTAYLLMLVKSLTGRNILNGFAYSYVIVLYPVFLVALASLLDRLRKSYLLIFLSLFLGMNAINLPTWSRLALGKKQAEPYRELADLIADSSYSGAPIIASASYIQDFYLGRKGLSGQLLSISELPQRFESGPPDHLWIVDSYDRRSDAMLSKIAGIYPVLGSKIYNVGGLSRDDASLRAILVALDGRHSD